MKKKIMIATGGTGGHIFPAMALSKRFSKDFLAENLLFAGGALQNNRYFDHRFPHRSIECATLRKKDPFSLCKSCYRIGKGVMQSLQIFRKYRPSLVVAFGSYYTFPILAAARLASIPYVLHEANAIPGQVNRLFSSSAVLTGIHFPSTAALLDGKSKVVGMPLRDNFERTKISKQAALEYFNFSEKYKTVLVFGGSQGAQRLNKMFSEAVQQLPQDIQILHFTGDPTMISPLQAQYAKRRAPCVVKPFEERMELAWRAADLMVSRAGASTIAEQLEFEVPGILVPYPFAADNHQEHNANFMSDIIGGGVTLLEKSLNPTVLAQEILFVQAKSEKMTQAMRDYKGNTRNEDFYQMIKDLLEAM